MSMVYAVLRTCEVCQALYLVQKFAFMTAEHCAYPVSLKIPEDVRKQNSDKVTSTFVNDF